MIELSRSTWVVVAVAAVGGVCGGCQAFENLFDHRWRSSWKSAPADASKSPTAVTQNPPPADIDPRILSRKEIKPNSDAAERFAWDEAHAQAFQSDIRESERQVHESVLPLPPRYGQTGSWQLDYKATFP
jgi:hypothetical protein